MLLFSSLFYASMHTLLRDWWPAGAKSVFNAATLLMTLVTAEKKGIKNNEQTQHRG